MRPQPFHRYTNGDVYTGELLGLARHGAGECKYGGGASVYQGQWEADRHEGQGRLSSRRGEEFDGEWLAGEPHGQGRRRSAERVEEEGAFEGGLLHGQGRRSDALGGAWRGVFVRGVLQVSTLVSKSSA